MREFKSGYFYFFKDEPFSFDEVTGKISFLVHEADKSAYDFAWSAKLAFDDKDAAFKSGDLIHYFVDEFRKYMVDSDGSDDEIDVGEDDDSSWDFFKEQIAVKFYSHDFNRCVEGANSLIDSTQSIFRRAFSRQSFSENIYASSLLLKRANFDFNCLDEIDPQANLYDYEEFSYSFNNLVSRVQIASEFSPRRAKKIWRLHREYETALDSSSVKKIESVKKRFRRMGVLPLIYPMWEED